MQPVVFCILFYIVILLPTKHLLGVFKNSFKCWERFEPGSHFKSRLSLIVRGNEKIFKCVPVFLIKWKFGNVCFWQEGKTGLPGEKPFGTNFLLTLSWESQQKTQPIYANKNQCNCNVIILKALLFKVLKNFPLPNFLFLHRTRGFWITDGAADDKHRRHWIRSMWMIVLTL